MCSPARESVATQTSSRNDAEMVGMAHPFVSKVKKLAACLQRPNGADLGPILSYRRENR